MITKVVLKGGPDSGHHGHAGRPGSVGGSVAGSVAVSLRTGRAAAAKRGIKPEPKKSDVTTRLTSRDGVKEYGEANWREWRDNLTLEQAANLQIYSEATFEPVNNYMRSRGRVLPDPEFDNVTEKDVRDLISTIDSTMVPLPGAVVVHRTFGKDMDAKIRNMSVGDSFTDRGFTSTNLIDTFRDGQKLDVEIRVPKGVRAAYMAGFVSDTASVSLWGDEDELLLTNGLTYRKVGESGGNVILEVSGG